MLKETVSGIDNDTVVVDAVRLGAPSGLDTGTSGTFYLDNFESRRQNYIGLDPDVPFSDLIFADDFESGGLSAWGSAVTDGGDLSTGAAAAVEGGYGLQALIDDDTDLYVLDRSPMEETHYRARFYLDPNTIDLVNWDRFVLLLDSNWSFNVSLAYGDGDTGFNTADYEISDAWHAVEIEWAAQEESTPTPTPTETPTPTPTPTPTSTPTSSATTIATPTPTVSPASPRLLMGMGTPTLEKSVPGRFAAETPPSRPPPSHPKTP